MQFERSFPVYKVPYRPDHEACGTQVINNWFFGSSTLRFAARQLVRPLFLAADEFWVRIQMRQ